LAFVVDRWEYCKPAAMTGAGGSHPPPPAAWRTTPTHATAAPKSTILLPHHLFTYSHPPPAHESFRRLHAQPFCPPVDIPCSAPSPPQPQPFFVNFASAVLSLPLPHYIQSLQHFPLGAPVPSPLTSLLSSALLPFRILCSPPLSSSPLLSSPLLFLAPPPASVAPPPASVDFIISPTGPACSGEGLRCAACYVRHVMFQPR